MQFGNYRLEVPSGMDPRRFGLQTSETGELTVFLMDPEEPEFPPNNPQPVVVREEVAGAAVPAAAAGAAEVVEAAEAVDVAVAAVAADVPARPVGIRPGQARAVAAAARAGPPPRPEQRQLRKGHSGVL